MKPNTSFHNTIDVQVRAYQKYGSGAWWGGRWVTIRDRSLQYQFFPHFHPYVLPLVQRLNDGGVDELQDSDTLYLPQPAGPPLSVLPDSTRAMVAATVNATRPDGTPVSLSQGTPITLPDGTNVKIAKSTPIAFSDGSSGTLAADATVALPGKLPASLSSGIQWTISGKDIVVPDYTPVTLVNTPGPAVLTNDGSSANIPAGTQLSLRSGIPQPVYYEGIFDSSHYDPDATHVQHPYPQQDIDFSTSGAYSIYNWELFFHTPLLVAVHLSQNQKFQDAQNWFHYIFNPTDNSAGPTPERFWKVKPFQYTDVRMVRDILVNLSTNQDPVLNQETVDSIGAWKQNPFQPFAVAKYRPSAYMMKTVMAYLDNLIAWGDSLFQQYTIETINEATQLYILAANILGPKPQPIPKMSSDKALTYNNLRGKLDDFGNAMVDLESDLPFDLAPPPPPGTNFNGSEVLGSIGQTLYFCVPRNDKLLGYWDTVADRLFKIHNSLNLQGVFQRPPLFDPPIDPALLVRAAAAGLDVSAVVAGLNQPLPLVRFQALTSRATEICHEVKALGATLLAAIEKQDNESLSLLRAQHESAILQIAETVKYSQWQESAKSTQALEQTLATASHRYTYYQKLLGRSDSDITIPTLDNLDSASLETLNFTQADAGSEPTMALDAIQPDISTDSSSVSDGEMNSLIKHETEELSNLSTARGFQITAASINALGAVLCLIPQFKGHVQPMGCGATVDFGGHHIGFSTEALAAIARTIGDQYSYDANNNKILGGYSRRELEWTYQSNLAKLEITQTFKQLRAAQIREAIAKKEYDNFKTQIAQAKEIVDFLQGNSVTGFQVKETTTGFYAWMKREVKVLYATAFQLAFEVAKKAERAIQNEIGDPSLTFIRYNYLDGTEGLLAGEKLMLDLKAMELAYQDLNQREYELTKHVSLLQTDPLALLQLRATGSCSLSLPEEMFDLDGPGHYFRRIRSVAVTIPAVAGPYTGVNCTLSLQSSSIRVSPDVGKGYARNGSDDPRFNDYYGSLQSIVTSSGQADSGLFETNLHDERYLPFERAGIAGSEWRLTLPEGVRQFDYDTITDVILHVRYTAREGGDSLKAAAAQNLQTQIAKAQTIGSVRLFSLRHDFPSEWSKFRSVTIGGGTPTAGISLTLLPQHYPFWAMGIVGSNPVKGVQLFVEMPAKDTTPSLAVYDKANKSGKTDVLARNPELGGLLNGKLANIARPAAITDSTHPPFSLYFDNNTMNDVWIAITWGK